MDMALFLNIKGDLLYFFKDDLKNRIMRKIPGNFQIARLYNETIAAASFGTIYCYYIKESINTQSNSSTVFLYTKFVAHADTLTNLYISKHKNQAEIF